MGFDGYSKLSERLSYLQTRHELSEFLIQKVGKERCSPNNSPSPPYSRRAPVGSYAERSTARQALDDAEHNGIDRYKGREHGKGLPVQSENIIHCYKQICKAEQQPRPAA